MERREETLQSEEDHHGDQEQDLAGDLHLLPGCITEHAIVGIYDGRQEQSSELCQEVDGLVCRPSSPETCYEFQQTVANLTT